MSDEMSRTFFYIILMGLAATAVVLAQHAMHTQTIVNAVNTASASAPALQISSPSSSPVATAPASLAGTPTPYDTQTTGFALPLEVSQNYLIQ